MSRPDTSSYTVTISISDLTDRLEKAEKEERRYWWYALHNAMHHGNLPVDLTGRLDDYYRDFGLGFVDHPGEHYRRDVS